MDFNPMTTVALSLADDSEDEKAAKELIMALLCITLLERVRQHDETAIICSQLLMKEYPKSSDIPSAAVIRSTWNEAKQLVQKAREDGVIGNER